MLKQFCAECGQEMPKLENGSRLKCCNGYGYWLNRKVSGGFKLPKHGDYFLYINPLKWPKGKKAKKPNEDT